MTTLECVCPSTVEQFVMIEYPGFVKNVDKALDTMGGIDTIEKVFDSQKDRLELKFRKSDPLAHAAYGDRAPKKCLVIRIKRSKGKKTLSTSSTSTIKTKSSKTREDADHYEANVIATIQTTYKFETLAEFQWLPMQRTNQSNNLDPKNLHTGVDIVRTPESLNPQYASILDDVLPLKDPFDNTLRNFNPDAPLLILPALFSRFDTPREIHQPHPKFRSKEMREEFERQQSLSIIGRTRKRRTTMSYLLNFSDPVPDKPPEKLIKERALVSQQEKSMVPRLAACFERQKVWSKAALCFELNCSTSDIKFILPLVAFYYLTGPFRTMWVKYGYNPHKDPSNKPLQTLDFRVRNPQDPQEYSRRSMHQYQIPLRKNSERAKHYSQQLDLKSVISVANTSGASHFYDDNFDDPLGGLKNMASAEAMCKFRRDLIPPARQLSYQLKDIELTEVQSIVNSNDGQEPEICSEKDGWLPEGSLDKIRKIMTKTLHETVNLMSSQLEQIDE